jgi:RNA polymerase sigma factor (sigma-70 family)
MPQQPTSSRKAAQTGPSAIDLEHELSRGFARTLIRAMVINTSQRLRLTREDREDFEQTLAMGLVQRFSQFDAQRATWEGFALVVLRSCLSTEIKRFCRERQREPIAVENCDEFLSDDDREQKQTELQLDLQSLLARLSPEQRELCREVSQADSVRAASRQLDVPRRTLRDRLRRIRERMQK